MSQLRFQISMSLDGYVAGPDQSRADPLGRGGMRLHDWAFELRVMRALHGLEGGVDNASTPIVEASLRHIGATIMGRNMFGGQPGPWDAQEPWTGWWGINPPFHHPVFVLTHYPRPPIEMQGGTTFHFVTEGPQAALAQARRAAQDRDVNLGGGAQTARQFFRAGLIDSMDIHLVPILLAAGERLFDGAGDTLHGLRLVRTVVGAGVTHLMFRRDVEAAQS